MTLQEVREKQCYGTTIKDFKEGLFMTDWNDAQSILMLSMSIQSDVQEYIELDAVEYAEKVRQYLNLSKYCVGQAIKLVNDNYVARLPGEWGVK
jgi:hypothetical protein